MPGNKKVQALVVDKPDGTFARGEIERRAVGPHDVEIEIKWAGICGSDCHQVKQEWGKAIFPMVPGHEIVGIATAVGSEVKTFRVGDKCGVGCIVDSCRECDECTEHGMEMFCAGGGMVGTYNSRFKYDHNGDEKGSPTYGGYSKSIVVNDAYVLRVPDSLDFSKAAPLLCAGITTYSPLRHANVKKGSKVAVAGLGGLGHMAVQLAAAMGAEVTVLSRGDKKKEDAFSLGATQYVDSKDEEQLKKAKNSFDVIIDTINAKHDMNQFLGLLRRDGELVLCGAAPGNMEIAPFALIGGRKKVSGTLIGGIPETQEMLDFCAEHKVHPWTETITADQVDEAYERMEKSDVHYRFVIDTSTI